MDKHLKEALDQIPAGFYRLKSSDLLRADDLVWSWTSREFLRADSPYWLRSPLKDRIGDLVCAIRRARLEGFETSVRREFRITR